MLIPSNHEWRDPNIGIKKEKSLGQKKQKTGWNIYAHFGAIAKGYYR